MYGIVLYICTICTRSTVHTFCTASNPSSTWTTSPLPSPLQVDAATWYTVSTKDFKGLMQGMVGGAGLGLGDSQTTVARHQHDKTRVSSACTCTYVRTHIHICKYVSTTYVF